MAEKFYDGECTCVCVLGTGDIVRVHGLPFGRESSICEATV